MALVTLDTRFLVTRSTINRSLATVKLDFHAALRAIARAQSLQELATTIVSQIATSRSVVLVRVWYGEPEAIALAGSAGTPSGGGSYSRLDGEFREMAIADSTIREIASSRELFAVRSVRGDEPWLTNSAWVARQGVRAFVALPLRADDQVMGALALFDRDRPDEDLLSQLQVIGDLGGLRAAELHTRAPTTALPGDVRPPEQGPTAGGREVVTRAGLRQIERESIEAALAKTGGRVFGEAGAAVLLGMRPTTLASRMKALGINKV